MFFLLLLLCIHTDSDSLLENTKFYRRLCIDVEIITRTQAVSERQTARQRGQHLGNTVCVCAFVDVE